MQRKYDYVIVGAGSAGCALANRLSEDRAVSVLLIESGPPDKSPLIAMPRGIGKLLVPGNPHVWDYEAVPQPGLAPEVWLKGRTLGGSSSVNGTVYVRGAPADYDHWEAHGLPGWGWRDVGPHFVALENHELGASLWRGAGGPLRSQCPSVGRSLVRSGARSGRSGGYAPRCRHQRHQDGGERRHGLSDGHDVSGQTLQRGPRVPGAGAGALESRRAHRDECAANRVSRIGAPSASRSKDRRRCAQHPSARRIDSGGRRHRITEAAAALGNRAGASSCALTRFRVVLDATGVGSNLREHRYLAMQYRVTGGSLNSRLSGIGLLRSLVSYTAALQGAA